MANVMKIGFIGQGYVGKNYADVFEKNGYSIVRYSLEKEYVENKDAIKDCDIVFVAVPTPTTPRGMDMRAIKNVLPLVGKKKIAVIKSTLYPGATKELQKDFPHLTIVFSPEFLSEKTAAYDAAHPFSNIIGMPSRSKRHEEAATQVQKILPKAPHTLICSSQEAELIKYIHNGNGYAQVVFFNMMYDLVRAQGGKWDVVEGAIRNNPFISDKYIKPVHKGGRGAGGNCFIKDFAMLRISYENTIPHDVEGHAKLRSLEKKNGMLLAKSNKDQHIWHGVYGTHPPKRAKKKRT